VEQRTHKVTYFRINRSAPWSIDPFYSTKGHETISGANNGYPTLADAIAEFMAAAPEIDMNSGEITDDTDYSTRTTYEARDHRGYYTYATVTTYYHQEKR
jgi:hypothetical protein